MRVRSSAAVSKAAAEAAEDPVARRYLYCVIRTSEPLTFAAPGVAGPEHLAHTINFRDLGVVVSASPTSNYESTRRNMTSHMRVLEEVMRERDMLPVQFNSVSPSADSVLKRFLAPNYDDLSARLDAVAGRVEIGVKAFWRDNVLYEEIVQENDAIRRLRDRVAVRPPESAYKERIRLGEMVEKAMLAKRARESAAMLERLQPYAERVCAHDSITETMALNAAFFVKSSNQSVFERKLGELDAELGERVRFKCVGPVPPYNFVRLTLG
jgi:hypothetical protein